MNRLDSKRRAAVVAALVEGCSIRSACRMTGVAKGTVLKLLADLGAACADYMHVTMRNLPCKRIECDEVWSFCYAKDKNLPESMRDQPGVGSIWTWTAICADTKLIPAYHVGTRNAECAAEFISDLAGRLANRVQLTTDGLRVYLDAVEQAFGDSIDYAQLIKLYGEDRAGEARYSPAQCTGTRNVRITGRPDDKLISTSYIERSNLTLRMGSRRFTRLTNAFSKKVENLEHAVSLHMMHYNFARVHKTLRITPAMAAGISDHVWELEEIIALLDATEEDARDVAGRRKDRRESK